MNTERFARQTARAAGREFAKQKARHSARRKAKEEQDEGRTPPKRRAAGARSGSKPGRSATVRDAEIVGTTEAEPAPSTTEEPGPAAAGKPAEPGPTPADSEPAAAEDASSRSGEAETSDSSGATPIRHAYRAIVDRIPEEHREKALNYLKNDGPAATAHFLEQKAGSTRSLRRKAMLKVAAGLLRAVPGKGSRS